MYHYVILVCDMSDMPYKIIWDDDGDCVHGGTGPRKTKEDRGGARRSEEGRGGGRKGGKLCRDLSCVHFSAFLPLLFVLEASEISALSTKGSNRFTQIAFRAAFLNQILASNSSSTVISNSVGFSCKNTMQQAGKKLIKARLRDGVRTRCTKEAVKSQAGLQNDHSWAAACSMHYVYVYVYMCVYIYMYIYFTLYIIYIHKQYLETCIWKRIMHFLQCLPVWAGENVDPSMFAPSSNKQLSGQHRCRPLLVLPASDPKICISSLAQAQCGKANLAFHLSGSSELLAWSCGLVLADCTSLPNPMVQGGTQLWPAGAEVRTLRAFPYQGFVKAASRSALNMFQPRDTEGQRKRFYHEPIQQVSLPDRPFAQWFSLNFAFCYSVLLSLDPKPSPKKPHQLEFPGSACLCFSTTSALLIDYIRLQDQSWDRSQCAK